MAKRIKRMLSLLLAFAVFFGAVPSSIYAGASYADIKTQTEKQIVYEGSKTEKDGITVKKTVSATGTENYFDIDLEVVTQEESQTVYNDPSIAVVIVMDISATMRQEIGKETSSTVEKSRYTAAVNASKEFLKEFGKTSAGVGVTREVGFVAFNTSAHEIFPLTSVKTEKKGTELGNSMANKTHNIVYGNNYTTSWTRWTNMEAGLKMAYDMLNKSKADNKYVIFLTDGYPTTYIRTGYEGWSPLMAQHDPGNPWYNSRQANLKDGADGKFKNLVTGALATGGVNYSDKAADRADDQAAKLKKIATVYAVGVDLATQQIKNWEGTYNGFLLDRYNNNTYHIGGKETKHFENWMRTKIGSNSYTNYTKANALSKAFGEIFDKIQNSSSTGVGYHLMVSDLLNDEEQLKMGEYIDFLGFYDSKGKFVEDEAALVGSSGEGREDTASYDAEEDKISWNLLKSGYTSMKKGGVTTYTYNLTYRVRLANEASRFVSGAEYLTNGTTKLTYHTVESVNGNPEISGAKELEFDIPKIKGYLGSFGFMKMDHWRDMIPVPGAVFTLTHDENCENCGGSVHISIPNGTAKADGSVNFNNIPSGHTYTMAEKTAPEGYIVSDESWSVEVSYGRTLVENSAGKTVYDSQAADPKMTVTNEADAKYQRITVTKKWIGDTDTANTTEVTVDIYNSNDVENGKPKAGASPVDTLVITGSDYEVSAPLPTVDVKTGNTIGYTVVEQPGDDYKQVSMTQDGAGSYSYTITNLMNAEKDITILKEWVAPDRYAKEIGNVYAQVYRDGEPYGSVITLSKSNDWEAVLKNVPVYQDNASGKVSVYTVSEVDASGAVITNFTYKDDTYSVKSSGLTLTNTIDQDYVDISGTKIWKAAALTEEELKELEVTIALYADGDATGQKQRVSYDSPGYSFTGLDKYDLSTDKAGNLIGDGHEIIYTVKEVGEKKGEITIDGYDFEVTYKDDREGDIINTLIGTVDIKGEKIWVDESEETRPDSLIIELWANGSPTGTVAELKKGTNVSYEDGAPKYEDPDFPERVTGYEQIEIVDYSWDYEDAVTTYAFENLDKYDENGQIIRYDVKEVMPSGYHYDVSYQKTEDGYDVINTLMGGETSLTISKQWIDAGNSYEAVTVGIYREDAPEAAVETVELSRENGWTATVTELPLYDNGETVKYLVRELSDGVTVEQNGQWNNYKVSYTNVDNSWTITNKIDQEKTTVSAIKLWKGGDIQYRPNLTFTLFCDGIATNQVIKSTDADYDPENIVFGNLDVYNYAKNGAKYVYTIKETMDGRMAEFYSSSQSTNKDGVIEFENTFIPGQTKVEGKKTWIAGGFEEEVKVGLYANGELVKIQETKDLEYRFMDLDVYSTSGAAIQYTIAEMMDDGNGGWIPVENNGTYTTGGVDYETIYYGNNITNKFYQTEISVAVNKVWNGPVPQNSEISFTITRSSNGVPDETWSTELILSAANANRDNQKVWSGSVEGLEKMDANGYPYIYSVSEDGVVDGIINIEGLDYTSVKESGNTFVNTIVETNDASLSVSKSWRDSQEEEASPEEISVQLLADGVPVEGKIEELNEENQWTCSFENLPRYDSNTFEPITYSAKEVGEYNGVISLHNDSQRYDVEYINDGDHVEVVNTLKDTDSYFYRVYRYYEKKINGKSSFFTDHDEEWTESYKDETVSIDADDYKDCATDNAKTIYKFVSEKTDVTQGENGSWTFSLDEENEVAFVVEKYEDGVSYYEVYLHYYYSRSSKKDKDPDPVDPVDPEDPIDPPTDPEEPIEIEEPEVPLTPEPEIPGEEPDPSSGELEILDEEVPLANVPKTGDMLILYYAMAAISALGLMILGLFGKKRKA